MSPEVPPSFVPIQELVMAPGFLQYFFEWKNTPLESINIPLSGNADNGESQGEVETR